MNELLNLEQRTFKTFSIFSFFSLLTLITFLSMFSSKYTVTDINYEKNIDLNYSSFDVSLKVNQFGSLMNPILVNFMKTI